MRVCGFSVLAVLVCGVVAGQQPAVRMLPLPEFPSAQVAIPWTELKALIEERRPVAEDKKLKEKPPVEWSIARASYLARALDNGAAQVEAAFDIYVWKPEGYSQIPLLAAAVAPVQVLLDGETAPLVAMGLRGGLEPRPRLVPAGDGTPGMVLDETPSSMVAWSEMRGLVLDSPGPHRVNATFFAPLTAVEGVVTMDFPAAPAAITTVHLEVSIPDTQITAPDAARFDTTRTDTGVSADLAFRSAANINVSWRLPAKLVAPKPIEPPRVTCTTSTLAGVTERVVSCDTLLVFNILRGTTDAFAFTLPKAVNVLQVEGQGAAWTRVDEEDLQRVEVKVNYALEDQYTLAVRYELPIDSELSTVALPDLRVADVVRQSGWVGVVARDNVEIAPSPDIASYTRVDLSELPAALMSLAANPILLAYRYSEAGGELLLDVRKLADVPVRPATIDAARYTTLLTKEGTRMTRALYEVRNNVRQYLRIQLPEAAKVSSASVGGRLVKPARDTNAGSVLIPLLQSAVTGRQLGAFPVELTYTEEAVTFPARRGELDLALPAADLPIERATWEVWMPDTHNVFGSHGDMNPVDMAAFSALPNDSVEKARRTPRGVREATLHPLREGIERFFITDINNPAASVGGGPRYHEAPITEPENGAAVAGILPVAVQLPLEGIPYTFDRVLVEEHQPLHVSLSVYRASAAKRIMKLESALALLAGLALGWAVTSRHARSYLTAAAALLVLAGIIAYGYPYGLVRWNALALWVVVGFAAVVVPVLIGRYRRMPKPAATLAPTTATE